MAQAIRGAGNHHLAKSWDYDQNEYRHQLYKQGKATLKNIHLNKQYIMT